MGAPCLKNQYAMFKKLVCQWVKATDTDTECIILTAVLLQQWLHERSSQVRYAYIVCLVHSLRCCVRLLRSVIFVEHTMRLRRYYCLLMEHVNTTIISVHVVSACLKCVGNSDSHDCRKPTFLSLVSQFGLRVVSHLSIVCYMADDRIMVVK